MDIENQVLLADLKDGFKHGIRVCNLSRLVGKELGLSNRVCYDIALGGLLHDIGKLGLSKYLYGRNKDAFGVEEIKYMRMHSKLSYDIIKEYDFSSVTKDTVLYHHENYDGSGYPANLKEKAIPIGARILRVVDTFIALISVRPYRAAFDVETAVEIMIGEIKNYDMEVFIAFQRIINTEDISSIINCDLFLDPDADEELISIVENNLRKAERERK